MEFKLITGLLNLVMIDKEKFKLMFNDITKHISEHSFLHIENKTFFKAMKDEIEIGKEFNEEYIFETYNIDRERYSEYVSEDKILKIAITLREKHDNLLLKNVLSSVGNLEGSFNVKVNHLIKECTKLSLRGGSDLVCVSKCADDYHDSIIEYQKNPHSEFGVRTGFRKLDNYLRGYRKGNFIILASRPSQGKTTFAINQMINMLNAGENILFFSFEMDETEVTEVFLSNLCMIPINDIKDKYKNSNIKKDILNGLNWLKSKKENFNLKIIKDCNYNIADLKREARLRHHIKPLKLILIDYLQLLDGDGDYKSRYLEMKDISRQLKMFGKELGIPIVAIAQLKRDIEGRTDDKPRMSDLKECGDFEQDANTIMFLYDPTNKNDFKGDDNDYQVILAKNRRGSKGTIDFNYFKEHSKFVEISDERNY